MCVGGGGERSSEFRANPAHKFLLQKSYLLIICQVLGIYKTADCKGKYRKDSLPTRKFINFYTKYMEDIHLLMNNSYEFEFICSTAANMVLLSSTYGSSLSLYT